MKSNYWIFFILVVFTGCAKQEPKQTAFPVKLSVTTVEDVPQFVKGVGRLLPSLTVDMKAQVSGILTNVLFEDGQAVNEGDLLMTIDTSIYEAQVNQAQATVSEDQARLRYAIEFAETYGKLVGSDYVSRLDYEQAVQSVDSFKALVESDLAALKQAQIDLEHTQIRAPFKGYLGLRTFDPGNYVDAAANKSLVTVNKVTPLSVRFYLPSEYVQEIREKQQESALYLEAALPADPGHPLQGSLWFVDNTVDPHTGLITLEGTIPNLDERGWPGQFVRVYLRLKILKNAVLVPTEALMLGETGNFVFVVDPDTMTVTMRMVGKGIVYKDSNVATWGLKEGEIVVVDGQLNLFDGAKVYIPENK